MSVIKPVCGCDEMLLSNLESFFNQDYPGDKYELLFSATSEKDPAVGVVRSLMKAYPDVPAQMLIGDPKKGFNPKLNNMLLPYERAAHDVLVCSDSNVYAEPDLLRSFGRVWAQEENIGFVHQMPSVSQPYSFGSWLEYVYVMTTVLPMLLAGIETGFPCVWGKSFSIKKSDLEDPSIGGLEPFAYVVAEDMAIASSIYAMGLRLHLLDRTVVQRLGSWSVSQFWERTIRWAQYRKAMGVVMGGFSIEWIFYSPILIAFSAVSAAYIFSASPLFAAAAAATAAIFVISVGGYSFCAYVDDTRASLPNPLKFALAWSVVQLFLPIMWLVVLFSPGNSTWRGKQIVIAPHSHIPIKKE